MSTTNDTTGVTVTIAKEGHTHKGKPCKPGQKIGVSDRQAAWLEELGLIEKLTTKPTTSAPVSADKSEK